MLCLLLSHRQNNNVEVEEVNSTEDVQGQTVELNSLETEARPGDKRSATDHPMNAATKIARFELDAEHDENDWELPEGMLAYINKYMSIKVPDKEIKEKIVSINPIPKNVRPVPEVDGYIKQLLIEHGKTTTLHLEKVLKTAQERDRNILGPLSKLWMITEGERESMDENDEFSVSNFAEITGLFEQAMLLSAQTYQRMTFQRRYNILSTLIDNPTKVNELLKDHMEIMNDPNNKFLFGEKFEEILSKSSLTQKKLNEVFTGLKKPMVKKNPQTQPFRKGPLSQQHGSSTRGRGTFFSRASQRGRLFLKSSRVVINPRFSKCAPPSKISVCSTASSKVRSSSTIETLYPKLAKVNSRSPDIRNGSGLQNSISFSTKTTVSPSSISFSGGETNNKYRSFGDAKEGCNQESPGFLNSNSELYFHSSQKGWGFKTSDQFKKSEYSHPIYTFQNGKSFSVEGPSSARGLSMQTRSEGCILFSTSSSGVSGESPVSMGGRHLPISMPVFWSRASTKDIYKDLKNSNSFNEKVECTFNNLSRRHSDSSIFSGGSLPSQGHIDFFVTKSGFFDQHQEIAFSGNTQNSVSRCGNRLIKNVLKSTSSESREHSVQMSKNPSEKICNSKGVDFFDRQTDFISSSSIASTFTLSNIAKTTDMGIGVRERLRNNYCLKSRSETGVKLVDSKSESQQWESPASEFSTNSNFIGCIDEGLGCFLSKPKNRRSLECSGKEKSHQLSRIKSCKVSNSDIYKDLSASKSHSLANGQHDCFSLPEENGGNKKQKISCTQQGNLGNSNQTGDYSHSRTSGGSSQHRGRFPISVSKRFERMEVVPSSISVNLQSSRNSFNRLVCVKGIVPSPKISFLEARSFQFGQRCLSNKLEGSQCIRFSSVFSNTKSIEENSSRGSNFVSNNSSLANPSMVSLGSSIVNRESYINSKNKKSFTEPSKRTTSTSFEQNPSISGLDTFRKQLSEEGISEKAATLITASRRKGTLSHYESAWRKWSSWCYKRKVDPVRCSINYILDFLSDSFDQGLSHSTIAGYRSAISAFHSLVDGLKIGDHPRVSALLNGIFNKRPPQPKSNFVWDVEKVVNYLCHLGKNEDLNDEMLTKKLTMLLAVTSAARAHEICFLDIRYLVKHHSGYIFSFGKLTKVANPKKPRPPIKFLHFVSNHNLCVCRCIDDYLIRSKLWRDSETQLLLSFRNPHKSVATKTISRWITDVLKLSGIDTSVFTGHSTRSASTSKAKSCGVPTKEILKNGYWSNESVFQKTYSKEIVNDESLFQQCILSTSSN